MWRVLDVALDENISRLCRQLPERAVEQLDELGALELGERVRRGRVVGERRQRRLASAAPRPAPADVTRDRGEPAVEPFRVVHLVRVPPGLEQRLLGEILGGAAVAADGRAEGDEPTAAFRLAKQLSGVGQHVSPRYE
jgi:hypothetical protein